MGKQIPLGSVISVQISTIIALEEEFVICMSKLKLPPPVGIWIGRLCGNKVILTGL
jgi:hypothetical protein